MVELPCGNPSSGGILKFSKTLMKVEYKLGMQRELTLKVYDMSGREVLEQKKVKSGDQVNMSQLLRGIYQYQLIDKTRKLLMAEKLMKE